MIICRCEEVTYEHIKKTQQLYNCNARELKLRTRAGMGYCGGRTCRPLIDHITPVSSEHREDIVPLKYQPPVRPVTFGDFKGNAHG